jgi:hypothetical protein
MIETPGRIGPFKDGNGNLYTFIESSVNSNRLMCIKSTNGGDTWREIDGSNRPANGDVEALDVQVSNDGHYLQMVHHATTTIRYYEFKMSTAASNPDTWVTGSEVEIATTTGDLGQQCAAIAIRSDGDIIAFYNRYISTVDHLFYKIDTGGGFGSEETLEDQSVYEWHWASVVIGESDLCHIFYKGDNNTFGPIYHKSLNSSDTLSARQTVSSNAGPSTEWEAAITEAVYWDDAGEENILAVFLDNSTDLFSVNVRDDGTPDSPRAAADNFCARGETANYGDSRSCVASLALDGTKILR